ncbi:MAG: monofunctional biosynthetic peptidoglycan transglycosylase [Prevotellaceae bacterium]|nr:monofunctional biosynthetic peptidoglycan transglycosylase [Prevotellaceae bacterium]
MKTSRKISKWTGVALLCLFVFSAAGVLVTRWEPVHHTRLMSIRQSQFAKDKQFKHQYAWVDYNAISPHLVHAVVASEDNRFFQHHGFDWIEIQHAIKENKWRKHPRGASTITQQVAKNVFLWPDNSWLRKGLEVYYTALIECLWPKERIMEVYLNVAEMGKGVYGAEAAAQHYFKKNASRLTAREAALIAACLPSPLRRNPARPSEYMQVRASQILTIMKQYGS